MDCRTELSFSSSFSVFIFLHNKIFENFKFEETEVDLNNLRKVDENVKNDKNAEKRQ
jgi:hypothetical protein